MEEIEDEMDGKVKIEKVNIEEKKEMEEKLGVR